MKMILTTISGFMLMALTACISGPDRSSTEVAHESSMISQEGGIAVLPGIETLKRDGFKPLQGKRVGLITNPTGVDNNLVSTIDILAQAPGVKLTALFAPEHGVRGNYSAGEAVAGEVDKATGVKVYSLHGSTRKPSQQMLANVDVLVYDIQDIGCRSYTFISTMGLAMQAAAQAGIEFMVLDRPNPLGGERVEGNIVEPGRESFVGQFPIPYVYGLTPGELATYLNEEGILGKKVKLSVVKMSGWERDMAFEETGMPWVLPSPHIPTPQSALLYPATGIMGELDYVSIGVGYTLPFCLAGAPWIDGELLAGRLNALGLDGVKFRPISFKPYYAMFKGATASGVEIYAEPYAVTPLSLLQFYIMQELAAIYPTHKAFAAIAPARLKMFDQVCGTEKIRTLFTKSYKVSDIEEIWMSQAAEFKRVSSKYYIYK